MMEIGIALAYMALGGFIVVLIQLIISARGPKGARPDYDPEYPGLGDGTELWSAAMKALSDPAPSKSKVIWWYICRRPLWKQ